MTTRKIDITDTTLIEPVGCSEQLAIRRQNELIRCMRAILRPYDQRLYERQRTEEYQSSYAKKPCAFCERCRNNTKRRVVCAHIQSLDEMGTTDVNERNLIPLCECGTFKKHRFRRTYLSTLLDRLVCKIPRNQLTRLSLRNAFQRVYGSSVKLDNLIGCHQLFDDGLIKMETVQAVKDSLENPRGGMDRSRRQKALQLQMDAVLGEYSPALTLSRFVAEERKRLQKSKTTGCTKSERRAQQKKPNEIELTLNLIKYARLLMRPEYLALAVKHCRDLQTLLCDPDTSAGNKERILYERSFLEMIRQPPRIAQAIDGFRQARRYADYADDKDHARIICGLALAHAKILHWDCQRQAKTAKESRDILNEIQQLIETQSRVAPDDRYLGRWTISCLTHRAELLFRMGDLAGAQLLIDSAWCHRRGLNLGSGWTKYQAVHLIVLQGLIHSHRGKYPDALRCMARVSAAMTSARGKRPEGHGDVARCASWSLRMLLDDKRAQSSGESGRPWMLKALRRASRRMDDMAAEIVDGRSGLWYEPRVPLKKVKKVLDTLREGTA